MQPLQLKAFIKSTNSIIDINGYEVQSDTINIFDAHYIRSFKKEDIQILRCSGIKDHSGQYLFEGDAVDLWLPDRLFKGIVSFNNGAFVCEGVQEVILEWPNSMQIGKCGNIFTNPLVLQTVTV